MARANPTVRVALEIQLNAKAKRDAVARMDAGDYVGAQRDLVKRFREFDESDYDIPAVLRNQETAELSELAHGLFDDRQLTRKRANSQVFNRSRSK